MPLPERRLQDTLRRLHRSGGANLISEGTVMTVAAILEQKGRGVFTTGPNVSLEYACRQLVNNHIGALPVVDHDMHVIGIISKGDVIRKICNPGPAALQGPVSAAMTSPVKTCVESDSVTSVMEQMARGKFGHIPVLREGRVIAIISNGDVVRWRLNGAAGNDAHDMHAFTLGGDGGRVD